MPNVLKSKKRLQQFEGRAVFRPGYLSNIIESVAGRGMLRLTARLDGAQRDSVKTVRIEDRSLLICGVWAIGCGLN
jgi:hypothetical protein